MRTVTVEVPEGHMVKIVKEESMQPRYENCDKFVSEEQYKNLIDGKE